MNRRNLIRAGATMAVLAVYAPAALLTGCWDSSDVARLMSTLGSACSSLATILGNSALAATITKLTSIAATAVANWKPGSPTAEAIEAINDLEGAISQIPGINPTVSMLILLALGTADAILALLPQSVRTGLVLAALNARKRVSINNPPTKVSTFKDYWNDLIATSADAALMQAKL